MNTTQIGVDLAKTVFEIAVSDVPGEVRGRKRLTRARLRHYFEAHPSAHVFLAACGSAHCQPLRAGWVQGLLRPWRSGQLDTARKAIAPYRPSQTATAGTACCTAL